MKVDTMDNLIYLEIEKDIANTDSKIFFVKLHLSYNNSTKK